MIEKVSFGNAVSALSKTKSNYNQQYKQEKFNSSPAYLAAALSGLAIVGLAYVLSANKLGKNIQKTVKEGKKFVSEAIQNTNELHHKSPASSSVIPQAENIAKPLKKTSENEIIQNIDIKYLNNEGRKAAESGQLASVSSEQQKAYDKNIAFKPMKSKQKRVVKKLKNNNKKQSEQMNSIGARQPNAIIKKLYELVPDVHNSGKTAELKPLHGKFIA